MHTLATRGVVAAIVSMAAWLCWLGGAPAIAAVPSSEPPAIAALRASQDRSASVLREKATQLIAASSDPTERAWATLALAEFENDLENADTALRLLDALRPQAEALGYTDLVFALLERRSTVLVNRGQSAETESVLSEMQELADAAGEPGWRAQVLHDRGVLERKLGRFDNALRDFEQALAILRERNDTVGVARELNSIGTLHGRTGKFSDAVLAHNEALALSRQAGNLAETARSLRLLGVLYRNLDDEELASQYLTEALNSVEERNHREAIALHGELSGSLTLLGRLDEAAQHAQQAVTLAEQSGSPPNKVNSYTRMAELKLAQGDLNEAERWAERAYESFDAVAVRDQILLRITRARVAAARGDTAAALQQAQVTLEATRKIGDRILERTALDLLSEQQLATGDAPNAFVTRKAYQALDKALAMDIAGRRIAVLEGSLDRQRSEAARGLLERDNQIQALTLNRQRLIGMALIPGLVALLIVAVLLYLRNREVRRTNAFLIASRDELARLHHALLDSSSELERIANTDTLTGLSNRGAVSRELNARLIRARASGRPLSVLLLDIDHFKQINDRYGHQAGDAVLREIAQRLRNALPEEAALGRWGGEEFIAVLDDCPLPAGIEAAEKVRRALADRPVAIADSQIPVSASVGVASANGLQVAVDPLVGAADHALYRAKRAGRNRVESTT